MGLVGCFRGLWPIRSCRLCISQLGSGRVGEKEKEKEKKSGEDTCQGRQNCV